MLLITGWKEEANQKTESFGKIKKLLSKYYEKKQVFNLKGAQQNFSKFTPKQLRKKKRNEKKERHLRNSNNRTKRKIEPINRG